MKNFSTKELFKKEIDNIWNNPIFQNIDYINRGYAIQDFLEFNSILFIGLNPSYKEEIINEKYFFYNNDQQGKVHPYFNKFQKISLETGLCWSHIDLLYIRETNQKEIERISKTEE